MYFNITILAGLFSTLSVQAASKRLTQALEITPGWLESVKIYWGSDFSLCWLLYFTLSAFSTSLSYSHGWG
jgi:hypothetical protein